VTALLEARALRTGYGHLPVVFDIDIEVNEGEIVALLGANGAGKTTTLRGLSAMIPLISGEVHFAGTEVDRKHPERAVRRGLVHIPEGRGIFPNLEVEETLKLACAMGGIPRHEILERVDEIYELFPKLEERRTQTAGTLSGGEQQMLAIARGLIIRPKLLMIDEMSQGLAPAIVEELFEQIKDLPAHGVSLLIVEQFVGQALEVADRAYVLEKGAVTYSGSAKALAADEDFVKSSYLGDAAAERLGDEDGVEGFGDDSLSLPPELLEGIHERAQKEGVDPAELVMNMLSKAFGRGSSNGNGKSRR
jgi:branched-chain amino acid transport system ATP-binding protein